MFFVAFVSTAHGQKLTTIHSGTIVNGLNVASAATTLPASDRDSAFTFVFKYSDTMRVFVYLQVGLGGSWGAEFQLDTANAWTQYPNFRYVTILGDSLMNQFAPWDDNLSSTARTNIKKSGMLQYRLLARGHGALLKPSNGSSLADSSSTRPTFVYQRLTQ